MPAGHADRVVGGGGLDKLKSEAESVALPSQSKNFNLAQSQSEFEANDFAQRNFIAQHGGQARLAQIDGVSVYHGGIAGINLDVDFQRETGLLARIPVVAGRVAFAVTFSLQVASPQGCE